MCVCVIYILHKHKITVCDTYIYTYTHVYNIYKHSDVMNSKCEKLLYRNVKDIFHHFKKYIFSYKNKSNLKTIFGSTLGNEQSNTFH